MSKIEHRNVIDITIVWTRTLESCRIATDGERFFVYIVHGSHVLQFEECFDPAQALATGWLWGQQNTPPQ